MVQMGEAWCFRLLLRCVYLELHHVLRHVETFRHLVHLFGTGSELAQAEYFLEMQFYQSAFLLTPHVAQRDKNACQIELQMGDGSSLLQA